MPLGRKVDFYFFYDLTRLLVTSLLQSESMESFTFTKSSKTLPSSVGAVTIDSPQTSKEILSQVEKKEVETTLTSRTIDLMHIISIASQEFHGLFGEFVIGSKFDPSGYSRYNYQDIRFELTEISYFKNKRYLSKLSSWFYGEPYGVLISRGYAEGDDTKKEEPVEETTTAKPAEDESAKEGQTKEDDKSKTEEKPAEDKKEDEATTAAAASGDETTAASGGDEKSADDAATTEKDEESSDKEGDEESTDDQEEGEDYCACKKEKEPTLVFIVYHVSNYTLG